MLTAGPTCGGPSLQPPREPAHCLACRLPFCRLPCLLVLIQRLPAPLSAQTTPAPTGQFETHKFELTGASASCVLRLRVLNGSSSGGHAFKVRQLTLTDEGQEAGREHGTASTGTASSSKRKKRVSRQQRELIKGSY